MAIRSAGLVLLGMIAAVTAGCSGGRFSFNYYDDDPPPVKVVHVHKRPLHVCNHDHHDCYWDGSRVVVIGGHRHGPGCGHMWDGKHWVVYKAKVTGRHPPFKKAKVRRAHPPPGKTRVRTVP